jgi:hypothetical protein
LDEALKVRGIGPHFFFSFELSYRKESRTPVWAALQGWVGRLKKKLLEPLPAPNGIVEFTPVKSASQLGRITLKPENATGALMTPVAKPLRRMNRARSVGPGSSR